MIKILRGAFGSQQRISVRDLFVLKHLEQVNCFGECFGREEDVEYLAAMSGT